MTHCLGDTNDDGVVDVDDLLAVINGWGTCGTPPCPGDVGPIPCGGNGVIDVDDLLVVINGWGWNCLTSSFDDVGDLESVEDCMDMCSETLTPYSDDWDRCVNSCVDMLCEREVLDCD